MTDENRIADLLLQWEEHFEQGRDVQPEELCQHCPEFVETVRNRIAALKQMEWVKQRPRDSGEEQFAFGRGKAPGGGTVLPQVGEEPIPGYRLVERLGKGAFGEVWSAENLGRRYAVKFIHGRQDCSRARRCVHLEKEGLDRIKWVNHRFILHRHKHGSNGSGLVLLTELADTSLDQFFDGLRRRVQKLPLFSQALFFLRDAAEALDHLQANGLMHLDVKPANLLLVKERCKLGDFGTVRAIRPGQRIQGGVALSVPSSDNPEESTTVHFRSIQDVPWMSLGFGGTLFTNTGAFTTKYAPPEAFLGKFSRSFDQYSLALTFCELVAGTIPFREREKDLVKERMSGTLELGFFPEQLRPVITRALSPYPNERFQTCLAFVEAMWQALQPLVGGDRKARKWLDQWSVVGSESARPLLLPESLGEKSPEMPLIPGFLGTSRIAEKGRKRLRKTRATERGAGTILGVTFSLLRLFDHLGWIAGHWLRRKWKKTGPEIELFFRLTLVLALSLAVPVVLKVCVDRIRPLTMLSCWQEEESGGNRPTNTFLPLVGKRGEAGNKVN